MSQQEVSRRQVIGTGLVMGATLATGLVKPQSVFASTGPIAKTVHGQVRGYANDGVTVFKGIPYGASTTGANRFMPPQSPVSWTGVRDARDMD